MKTPVFIFEPEKLKNNFREFENLCKKYFSSYKIAYSVKTNSNKEVIETLKKENSGFEVASLEEIKLVPKSRFIIFNSPAKTARELESAIKNKFLINIDSKSEIEKISSILKGKETEVGLRVSFEESKFGIEAEKILETMQYARTKNLNVICLHFHQGTQLSLKKYEEGIRRFSNLIDNLIKNSKIKLKYIDIGGSFPDKQQLKNLNLKLEDYFSIVSNFLNKFNLTIILEPGRCLVSNAFYLLTKVIAIKETSKRYAVLDAGINLLPKITLANYKFSKFKQEKSKIKEEKKEYILAGPLLFSNDVLGKIYSNLKENDIIKVENVGAYCYNLAWSISYKKPKIKKLKYLKHND